MIAILTLTWHFYYILSQKKIFSSEILRILMGGKSTFRSYDKLDDSSELFSPYQILNSIPNPSLIKLSKYWLNLNFRAEPDLEFEGLLKRQHTRVKYFQGSLMSANDLERSKVNKKSKQIAGNIQLLLI